MSDPVVEAWTDFRRSLRRLGEVLLDANHFARLERIVWHEVETEIRAAADTWDDGARWRSLLTRFGLDSALELARGVTSRLLRKYLGHDR